MLDFFPFSAKVLSNLESVSMSYIVKLKFFAYFFREKIVSYSNYKMVQTITNRILNVNNYF